MYWNDEDLVVEPYNGNTKQYYCGKELLRFDPALRSVMYTVLVVDYSQCCCANIWSDGEIEVLFQDTSLVPNKHRKGGQSAQRFSQLRKNEIVQWFKSVNNKLTQVNGPITLGISFVYKKEFLSYLHTYNLEKIKTITKTEYTNISGIYDMVNRLEQHNI